MQSFILTFLTALSFCAAAQAGPEVPPPANGNYSYQGNFSVGVRLNYKVVYAFTEHGREELSKLRKNGYECWAKPRETYLCKAFASTDGAVEAIRSRVEREIGGKVLELGALRGEPSLISKGTDVAEYLVPQEASFDGKTYPDYRWVMTNGGRWSARLGDPTEAQFNLEGNALKMPLQLSITESNTAYSVFLVFADFLRM